GDRPAMQPDAGHRLTQQQQFTAPRRSRRANGRAGPADRTRRQYRLGLAGEPANGRRHRRRLGPRTVGARSRRCAAHAIRGDRGASRPQSGADGVQAAARARRLVSELPAVEMWTDGACRGNPGPGGWAVLIRAGAHEKEVSGGEPLTTNNRMELLAAIRGLEALK